MRNHQFVGDFCEQNSERYHVESRMCVVNSWFRFDRNHIGWDDDEEEREDRRDNTCTGYCWAVFSTTTSLNRGNKILDDEKCSDNSQTDDEDPWLEFTENLFRPNFRPDKERHHMNGNYSILRLSYIDFAEVKRTADVSLPVSTVEERKHAKYFNEHKLRIISKLNGDASRDRYEDRRDTVAPKVHNICLSIERIFSLSTFTRDRKVLPWDLLIQSVVPAFHLKL